MICDLVTNEPAESCTISSDRHSDGVHLVKSSLHACSGVTDDVFARHVHVSERETGMVASINRSETSNYLHPGAVCFDQNHGGSDIFEFYQGVDEICV
jgi:hypothetical protein